MGRAGDSLDDEFPPRSGGGSPLREELLVGRKRGKMVVVVGGVGQLLFCNCSFATGVLQLMFCNCCSASFVLHLMF